MLIIQIIQKIIIKIIQKRKRSLKKKKQISKIKYIIKIQSIWLAYKSKIQLRYILFIKKIENNIKKASENHLKNFFNIIKDKKKVNSNSVSINLNKLNYLYYL